MSIFVDEIREYPSGKWCHMWSDEDDAILDVFALRLGLKLSWSHTSWGITEPFYHYDLTPDKRVLALKYGAKYMPLKDWIEPRHPQDGTT